MKKRLFNSISMLGLSVIITLLCAWSANAQKESNIWFSGSTVVNFKNFFSPTLSVAKYLVENPYGPEKDYFARFNCASISDSTGELILYLDALSHVIFKDRLPHISRIYNCGAILDNQSKIIKNGDSLWVSLDAERGSCFVPIESGESKKYIFFHMGLPPEEDTLKCLFLQNYHFNFYYTIVGQDSNGAFQVEQKNILIQKGCPSRFLVTRHIDGKKWWVMGVHKSTREIFTYLMDGTRLKKNPKSIQLDRTEELKRGALVWTNFSIDSSGSKIAVEFTETNIPCSVPTGEYANYLNLFQFNRLNGHFELSHSRLVRKNIIYKDQREYNIYIQGSAISNDGRKIYWIQSDLISSQVLDSVKYNYSIMQASIDEDFSTISDTIPILEKQNEPSWLYYFGLVKSLNGKIFFTNSQDNDYSVIDSMYLSVIMSPNKEGKECDARPQFLKINKGIFQFLPYFPDYQLGKDTMNYSANHFIIPDTVVCAGTRLVLGIDGLQGYRYRWFPDSSIITDPSSLYATARPYETTTYTLTKTFNGKQDSAFVHVEVKSKARANFEMFSMLESGRYDYKFQRIHFLHSSFDETIGVPLNNPEPGKKPWMYDSIYFKYNGTTGKSIRWEFRYPKKVVKYSGLTPPPLLMRDILDENQYRDPSIFTIVLFIEDLTTDCVDSLRREVAFIYYIDREKHRQSHFNIYPNPAQSSFTFAYQLNEKAHADIFSVTGQKIGTYELSPSQNQIWIDTNLWAEGIYYCRVSGASTPNIYSTKIIIVK